jgi:dUTP diphosphatase
VDDAHSSASADTSSRSIVVERLHEDARLPRRATEGSAGYDLFAYLHGRRIRCSDGVEQWQVETSIDGGASSLELPPGAMALVPLGFKARLPLGYEAQIRPRSGTTFKRGLQIPNAPGTIDSDFPDEWMVLVRNPNAQPIRIDHGERIAQMVLQRYEVLPFAHGDVSITTDRAGGFGSTGE